MSQTNDIACDECKEKLWVGQRDYIYRTTKELDKFEAFLIKHRGHKLCFYISDLDENRIDYRESGD